MKTLKADCIVDLAAGRLSSAGTFPCLISGVSLVWSPLENAVLCLALGGRSLCVCVFSSTPGLGRRGEYFPTSFGARACLLGLQHNMGFGIYDHLSNVVP